jgi:dolichyl-phosphate beta-glucosyltransferase
MATSRVVKMTAILSFAMPPYLSIVIPAYNEALRLPRTLSETISFLEAQSFTSEIIVVTDGSTDQTVSVTESFMSRFPALKVISFVGNKGKGFSVKVGMLAADGEYRLFMDADYAVPVQTVLTLLESARSGFDIVIGSRAMADSVILVQQDFIRRQLTKVFSIMQDATLRLPFEDTQCGFKLFTAAAAELYFPQITFDCAYFDAELLYVAHNAGARIAQMPITWQHDHETRLPIGVKRSVELAYKMLAIPRIHAHLGHRVAKNAARSIKNVSG